MLHRLGIVPVAEASVIIRVSKPHRDDAYHACRCLFEQLKVQVPSWKRENYADGTTEWVQGSSMPDLK
jgi:molybdopterin synthase catalytic subunit